MVLSPGFQPRGAGSAPFFREFGRMPRDVEGYGQKPST